MKLNLDPNNRSFDDCYKDMCVVWKDLNGIMKVLIMFYGEDIFQKAFKKMADDLGLEYDLKGIN